MNRVKKYLNEIRYIDKNINYRQEQLENLKASFLGSPAYSKHKVQTSRTGRIDDRYVKYLELSDSINEQINELWDLKQKVDSEIERLDDRDEVLVLKYRYILNKQWKEIAALIACSERHVLKIHGNALLSFKELYFSECCSVNDTK